MPLKSLIVPRLAERMLSEDTLNRKRAKFERERIASGRDHVVEFFHDPADPYSNLLKQILPEFERRYAVTLLTRVVSPPSDSATPERDLLRAYAKRDAKMLAQRAGVTLLNAEDDTATDTRTADECLKTLGHYQGGMIYYAGEWYWGLDRLHYLETRLSKLGLRKPDSGTAPIYAPPTVPSGSGATGAELHWYASFRSPYSAIARDRVKTLADAYGATLKLRFVLPMVMRGLPVPPAKKKYIPLDTAREARRLGVPFGRIMDPVGKPVELAYSLIPWAREQGRDYDYARSWLAGVWSEGIDAGQPRGLRKIVERAGLDWTEAQDHLENDAWRAEAEANRAEMMARGVWGVPSFRIGDKIIWGQDRLWAAEDALRDLPR